MTSVLREASQQLNSSITALINDLDVILLGFAALSVFSLAVVNILKEKIGHIYYRKFILHQIGNSPAKAHAKVIEEFIFTHAVGGKDPFYEQDIGALFSSIGRVANLVMSTPTEPLREDFMLCWLDLGAYPSNLAQEYAVAVSSFVKSNTPTDPLFKTEDANEKKALKTRVKGEMEAQLTGFKIRMDRLWRRILRSLAIAFAVALAFLVFYDGSNPGSAFVLGLFSGLFSPIAHDLINVIRGGKFK